MRSRYSTSDFAVGAMSSTELEEKVDKLSSLVSRAVSEERERIILMIKSLIVPKDDRGITWKYVSKKDLSRKVKGIISLLKQKDEKDSPVG